MKRKSRIFFGFVVLLAAMVAQGFSEGVHWMSKTIHSPGDDEEQIDHFLYMPRMMKMMDGRGERAVILRLDKELMIMINLKDHTYQQVTFDEMEQMMKSAGAVMDAQMEAMREQLAQLPEEQRKMAEQMMGSRMKKTEPKIEVSATGNTETISGYACREYVVTEDGERSATVWATHDVAGFASMKKDMMEFAKRMKEIVKSGMKETPGIMEGIDGFPIQTETAGGTKTIVTRIEEMAADESEFAVPAGYTREEMPKMGEMPEEGE
jgi:GLPGLI family protein